jgi:hypothetical protein
MAKAHSDKEDAFVTVGYENIVTPNKTLEFDAVTNLSSLRSYTACYISTSTQ